MTKRIRIGNRSFDYPITGDINYGEDATGAVVALAEAVAEFFGPGDIRTTDTSLQNGTSSDVTGLSFDVSFVQRIEVTGIITRSFNTLPTITEAFTINGAYNGTDLIISVQYAGDDTQVEFNNNLGQITYTSADVPDTSSLSVRFRASTIIDEQNI